MRNRPLKREPIHRGSRTDSRYYFFSSVHTALRAYRRRMTTASSLGRLAHTYIGRLSPRVTQPRTMRYTNQNPTRPIGSHMKRRPIPKVAMMQTPQREIQSSPNQNVRICQRKCDSSQVPRASLCLIVQNDRDDRRPAGEECADHRGSANDAGQQAERV